MRFRKLHSALPVLFAAIALSASAQIPGVPLPAIPDTTSRPVVDTAVAFVDTLPPRTITTPPVVWLIDESPIRRARIAELRGSGIRFPIFRSTSSLLWSGFGLGSGVIVLMPQVQIVNNTAIPYSRNDGALRAGHGSNARAIGGVAFSRGSLRFILAPELTTSSNDTIAPRNEGIIPSPTIPAGRNPFSYPWYANGPYSIDVPLLWGDRPRRQLHPGQSSILMELKKITFGFTTENEWWGPGIDNALILSNNAAGFPHLTVRSSRPLRNRLGATEFRWLVGSLSESSFFDDNPDNNTRSIASAAIAIRPRLADNLTVGFARSVVGTATGWGQIPFRWFDVLHNTGHPNDGAPYDSTLHPGGRDQIMSVFARWALPASGAEIYGEWGRMDFPRNLRDALVEPNRGLAYTLGLQWTRQAFSPYGVIHLRVENTSLEQNLAQKERFAGVWYTSRRVLQGFTNEGESLGAAVGPGSSGQTAEVNYLSKRAFFGIDFARSRLNEDVHQASPMLDYLRWCSHDVNLEWGLHGGVSSRIGTLSVRSRFQDRLNAYFQSGHGCPRSDAMVDIRNQHLSITFSPFARF